jgi:hypothetical protein
MGVLGYADRMQFGGDAAWLAGGLSAAFGGLVGSESEWARLPSPEAAFLRGPARGSQNRKGAGRSRRRDTVITTRDTRVPFWKSTMGSQSGNSKTARMKHRHAHDPRDPTAVTETATEIYCEFGLVRGLTNWSVRPRKSLTQVPIRNWLRTAAGKRTISETPDSRVRTACPDLESSSGRFRVT